MKPTPPTITDVKRMLQRSGRIEGLVVSWERRPRWITYPTGVQGWDGSANVQAPGYRAHRMIVTRDAEGTLIR